jgi:hypothetical protein
MTISYGLDEWVWTTGRCTNTSLPHLLPIDNGAYWISYTISTTVFSARIMQLEVEAYPHFRLALGQSFSVCCWIKNVICKGRPTTYIFRHKKSWKFSSNPFAVRHQKEVGGQHHPPVSYPTERTGILASGPTCRTRNISISSGTSHVVTVLQGCENFF